MFEVIGWIGAACFSFCGLPQAVKTYKTKSAKDFSWCFLGMWLNGEILTFLYVVVKNVEVGVYQYPLLVNYVLNFLIVLYLGYAKFIYRGEANADCIN